MPYSTSNIGVTLESRLESPKVIGNGTIRQAAYEFLFFFHCNYGRILYRFRNKARYWSKNANFSYLLVFNLHDLLEPLRIFAQKF